MSGEFTESVDETIRQRFESDWLEKSVKGIEVYLPAEQDSRYLGTLEELVHIDLEFRWKEHHAALPSGEHAPQRIEIYLERFPRLAEPAILARLVLAEFEMRHRFADQPAVEEYVRRFPDLSAAGIEIALELAEHQRQMVPLARPVVPGDRLGRYRLVAEHGRGGFGAVWRADDTKLGRRIALKRLSSQLYRQSESRRRFVSEARITAKLEHPGIVPIYDISSLDEEYAYYTMRLVRGRTLAEAIDELYQLRSTDPQWSVAWRSMLTAFVDVCHTVEYCHAQGVVHRDIKPHNIVLGNYGETILLDWGLASVVSSQQLLGEDQPTAVDDQILRPEEAAQTLRGSIKGTPAYMPPEQARGQWDSVGKLSDIYSLGGTLYQLITGTVPFSDGPVEQILRRVRAGQLTRPRAINARVHRALQAICLKAMHPDADHRYPTVSQLIADVQQFLAGEPVSVYREPVAVRCGRWMRKHKTAVASAGLCLVFLVAAAITGSIVWQQMRQRHLRQVAEIRGAAERAEAAALGQLQTDGFESALGFLRQATQLLEGQPAQLMGLRDRVQQRMARLEQIVNFYRLGHLAQEYTFFDQLTASATCSQAALQQIGALQHPDWWEHLPDEDLTPIQRHRLRSEVYRQLGVLATMRIGQQAESGFSLGWALEFLSGRAAANDRLRSGIFAASQANRYRPARILQIVESLGSAVQGQQLDVSIAQPLNPTDAAMLGSILDTHAPSGVLGRAVLTPLIQRRDPRETARAWLLDALTNAPDWYWLSIFIAINELKSQDYERSIRSLSHAVGVRPDGWVGFLYRAYAYTLAAAAQQQPAQRDVYLRNAARDVQRARDLENNRSELYWMYGFLLAQTGGDPRQTAEAFLQAMKLHPQVEQIGGGHFGSVTQQFLQEAGRFADAALRENDQLFEVWRMRAAIDCWTGDYTACLRSTQQALRLEPADGQTMALRAMAALRLDADDAQALEQLVTQASRESHLWHAVLELGLAQERQQRYAAAIAALRQAAQEARAPWQLAAAQIALARCLLRDGQTDAAMAAFDAGHQADLSADFQNLLDVARQTGDTRAVSQIESQLRKVQPYWSEQGQSPIEHPALINGDFQLGLSYGWGEETGPSSISTWANTGGCRSLAQIVADPGDPANEVLYVRNETAPAEGRSGSMRQTFPVSARTTYEITFRCRSAQLQDDAFVVLARSGDSSVPIPVSPGTDSWHTLRRQLHAPTGQLEIQLISSNRGEVWLDDLTIEIVPGP